MSTPSKKPRKPSPKPLIQAQRQRRKERRKLSGMCVACGKQPIAPRSSARCEKCLKAEAVRYRTTNGREHAAAVAKAWGQQQRTIVIDHYTNGTRRCMCPGCTTEGLEFLVLDHVRNDGAQHRQATPCGVKLYRWCILNQFPDCIQVLCWNCNSAKAYYGAGQCPGHGGNHNETALAARREANKPAHKSRKKYATQDTAGEDSGETGARYESTDGDTGTLSRRRNPK